MSSAVSISSAQSISDCSDGNGVIESSLLSFRENMVESLWNVLTGPTSSFPTLSNRRSASHKAKMAEVWCSATVSS